MKRHIVSFDTDEEGHWRVLLDCGHHRHTRHRPPLENREWIFDEHEREARIGVELNCKVCDDETALDDP